MTSNFASLIAATCFALPIAALAQNDPMPGKTMCVIDGKTYYQNGPCPGARLTPASSPLPSIGGRLPYSADDTFPAAINYMRNQDEEERSRNPLCRNYSTKALYIGIKEEELRCFYRYRNPIQVNITTTARGMRKQYVYRDTGEYLYFEDGVMTSMQGQQP